jgi:hypothetical protein
MHLTRYNLIILYKINYLMFYFLSFFLLQQLACDIYNDPVRKLAWMTDVANAIIPTDPMIAMHVHVRLIFDQVYNILNHM